MQTAMKHVRHRETAKEFKDKLKQNKTKQNQVPH